MSKNKDNLLEVLRTLFKWKKAILYLCLAAGILAAIIVLLVPVYYQSTTTFFVTSPDQSKPELIFGSSLSEPELYGNESDIDRLLTIAESNELISFLIDSFQLYQHYDIDTLSVKAPYYVKLKFLDLYEVQKTKRDAIQITIEDKDPDIATQITKACRDKINSIAQNLIKTSQEKKITTYLASISQKQELLRIISDSLILLRQKYGIYNPLAQSEILTSDLSSAEAKLAYTKARLENLQDTRIPRINGDTLAYLKSQVAGLEQQVENLTSKLKLFNSGVARVEIYNTQYKEANKVLSEEQEILKQYQSTYHADIPTLLLVEEAELPIIKSRPKRTLIVLASVLAAFFFSIIGVLLFDNYKDVNWREVYHGR